MAVPTLARTMIFKRFPALKIIILLMHHLWRVRSVAVGNVKSWRRVSIPGWRWVWELLVASTVVYLQRPVVRVAHVHCSDDRGRWGMLQALVSQKARWVLSVCHRLQHRCYPSCCWHCLKPPGSWNLAEAGESPGSAGSLWRGSRAPHCCHFSQDCNIFFTKYLFTRLQYLRLPTRENNNSSK